MLVSVAQKRNPIHTLDKRKMREIHGGFKKWKRNWEEFGGGNERWGLNICKVRKIK